MSSFRNTIKEHHVQHQRKVLVKDQLKSDREFLLSTYMSSLSDAANTRITEAFQLEKQLETETKRLQSSLTSFKQITLELDQHMKKFNRALKELGDVEQWTFMIERDVNEITTVIDLLSKR